MLGILSVPGPGVGSAMYIMHDLGKSALVSCSQSMQTVAGMAVLAHVSGCK